MKTEVTPFCSFTKTRFFQPAVLQIRNPKTSQVELYCNARRIDNHVYALPLVDVAAICDTFKYVPVTC